MSTLIEKDLQYIWHPYTPMKLAAAPIGIVKGEGTYLIDEAGNRYLDAIASWWTNLHGHAHPHMATQIAKQVATLEHVIFAGFTHPAAVQLAERLLALLPNNQQKVFYSDNGSTAVEVALKMAFQYWHNQGKTKTKIIAFENAYHGDTFGAMSVSGRGAFTQPFSPFLFDVLFIPLPQAEKEAESIAMLEKYVQDDTVAAFIYEPLVQGTAGMQMYSPALLDRLMQLCQNKGILCIADEVMTGFGRTGKLFASHYLQQKPDMVCLSKGLTGGAMAFGVTTATEAIFEHFWTDDRLKTLFHGHSYTANPLACAAGLASLDILLSEQGLPNIERIAQKHQAIIPILQKQPHLQNIRQQGTILAVDVVVEEGNSYFSHIRDTLYQFFINHQILLRPLGNILYILPPYCISNEDLDRIYDAIIAVGDYLKTHKKG